MKKIALITLIFFVIVSPLYSCKTEGVDYENRKIQNVDICIYGGTSGGVIAAYTASRLGKSVLLVEPTERIGGMTTGGLGQTDIGNKNVIKGYALDFYRRVGEEYGKKEPVFCFEPHVALDVFHQYVKEANLNILYDNHILSVTKSGNTLQNITLENVKSGGRTKVYAKEFIDCSYEGDLMAKANVSYTIGREPNSQYGETWNGVQMLNGHQFPDGVDPYVIKGDPSSGLLYGILPDTVGMTGSGDKHIQAYNFRITLTNDSTNRIPITPPKNYDPSKYELMIRLIDKAHYTNLNDLFIWSKIPNNKTDINNRNGFSTDMIGANWEYPDGSYEKRKQIFKDHLDYTLGMLYFVGHDLRIPESIRKEMEQWGYPKDEYKSTNHFTPQLYIREARRMIGRMVMTQNYCTKKEIANDPIGWGAYTMDSHNCGRYIVNRMVKNEGNVEIPISGIYNISYRAITPKENEASNLLVPVCLSASHIAYGSIRMEPVFMVLGETSAIASSLAIDKFLGCVQKVKSQDVMNVFFNLK